METKQLYEKVGNEFKPINPSVSLDELIDKETDLTLGEILVKYNHLRVNWKGDVATTRKEVPVKYRHNGLYITYNNGTDVVTEYYVGNNNSITTETWTNNSNWKTPITEDWINANMSKLKPAKDSVGYEQLTPALRQLVNQNTNVTNYPDDEDLTSQDNLLKFKDREYNEEEFSGKGYVILRKNLKKVNGVTKNILEQSMINKENTIYEIRYDFDLNGGEIEVPEECTLKFEGGMLRNGTVKGNSSIIEAVHYHIFDNISLSNLKNKVFPVEWFGASSKKTHNEVYINEAINQINNCQGGVLLLSDCYEINDTIYIQRFVSIEGENAISKQYLFNGNNKSTLFANFKDKKKWVIDYKVDNEIIAYNKLYVNDISTDRISFVGFGTFLKDFDILNKEYYIDDKNENPDASDIFGGIRLRRLHNTEIHSVNVEGFYVCIDLSCSWNFTISDCVIRPTFCGIYFDNVTQSVLHNVYILKDNIKANKYDKLIVSDNSIYPPYGNYDNVAVMLDQSATVANGFTVQSFDTVMFSYRSFARILSIYLEKITKSYFWVAEGTLYCVESELIEYYTEYYTIGGTDKSFIQLEGISQCRCYPSTNAKYVIIPKNNPVFYYDDYSFDEQFNIVNGKVAVNKQFYVFTDCLFYSNGKKNRIDSTDVDFYFPQLRLGVLRKEYTDINEIFKRNDSLYNNKVLYNVLNSTDINYNDILMDKSFTFDTIKSEDLANIVYISTPLKISRCNLFFNIPIATRNYDTEYFDIYDDCKLRITNPVNSDNSVHKKLIKICKNNITVDLYINPHITKGVYDEIYSIDSNVEKYKINIYNLEKTYITTIQNINYGDYISSKCVKISLTDIYRNIIVVLTRYNTIKLTVFYDNDAINIYTSYFNNKEYNINIYKDVKNACLYIKSEDTILVKTLLSSLCVPYEDNIPDTAIKTSISIYEGIDNNVGHKDGTFKYHLLSKKPLYCIDGVFYDSNGNMFKSLKTGTTEERPSNVQFGYFYYDTSIGKPIWYKGSNVWIDANGLEV